MNRSEMRDQLKILHDKNDEKRQCSKLLKELAHGRKAALVDIYEISGRQMFAVAKVDSSLQRIRRGHFLRIFPSFSNR